MGQYAPEPGAFVVEHRDWPDLRYAVEVPDCEDVTIANSDANGETELRGDVANGRLRIVASGYAPSCWNASWTTPRVTLVQE